MSTKHSFWNCGNKSFTLVELLIVIGILAILTAAVVVVLNPAELLKQARDSKRLQDLTSVDQSLQVSQAIYPDISLGTASTVYVSVADTTSTCANLGLPTLPSGWTYNCVTSANLVNSDGTGWIPVNFQDTNLVGAVQLSALPIDPINTTSTGLYYTYVMGGSWEITALTEAEKHDAAINDGGMFPGVLQKGSYLDATPGTRDNGLVGYWAFEEGSGSTAYDTSVTGNNGSFGGTPTWITGKVGNYAIDFDVDDNIYNDWTDISFDAITMMIWVRMDQVGTGYQDIFGTHKAFDRNRFHVRSSDDMFIWYQIANTVSTASFGVVPSVGTWYHLAGTWDKNDGIVMYINGQNVIESGSVQGPTYTATGLFFASGGSEDLNGDVDDARIYNRALSEAEVQAIYNATQ